MSRQYSKNSRKKSKNQFRESAAFSFARFICVSACIAIFQEEPAFACEPCSKIFNLNETAQAADTIIVGRKIGEGPTTIRAEYPGGPDWIEVKVLRTLKGEVSGIIRVNSWDAICTYGIIVDDDKEYIMFLEKRIPGPGEVFNDDYRTVEDGCAVKILPVEDNAVITDLKRMSVDEFVMRVINAR